MKKLPPIITAMLLMTVATVYAAELTPETGCCLDFEKGLQLPAECNQYDINEERCDDIITRYKAARDAPVYIAAALAVVLAFIAWLILIGFRKFKKKIKKRK